jgi:hypothetical protein
VTPRVLLGVQKRRSRWKATGLVNDATRLPVLLVGVAVRAVLNGTDGRPVIVLDTGDESARVCPDHGVRHPAACANQNEAVPESVNLQETQIEPVNLDLAPVAAIDHDGSRVIRRRQGDSLCARRIGIDKQSDDPPLRVDGGKHSTLTCDERWQSSRHRARIDSPPHPPVPND